MTLCIVDSSAVGPMLFADEAHDLLPGIVDHFGDGNVLVPSHWLIEVGSMLQNATRRQRIDLAARTEAINLIISFAVVVDDVTLDRLWTDTLPLADRHGLTIYDAAYLELARRKGAILATGDRALKAAAAAEKIRLL